MLIYEGPILGEESRAVVFGHKAMLHPDQTLPESTICLRTFHLNLSFLFNKIILPDLMVVSNVLKNRRCKPEAVLP